MKAIQENKKGVILSVRLNAGDLQDVPRQRGHRVTVKTYTGTTDRHREDVVSK